MSWRWRRSPAWAASSPARHCTRDVSTSPRRSGCWRELERAEPDAFVPGTNAPGWPERCTMKVARVIPCLDVTDGRVVKGTNFVELRDAGDPVELASRYDAEGADELVF